MQAHRSLCLVVAGTVGSIRQQPHEIRHTYERTRKNILASWTEDLLYNKY